MRPENSGVRAFLRRRILGTLVNSCRGLWHSAVHEEAFRVELILSLVLVPGAFLMATDSMKLIALIGSALLVLIVELLNTAVEATVDRIGSEFHELSGRAKDAGSAAVMVSLILLVMVWGIVALENFWPGYSVM